MKESAIRRHAFTMVELLAVVAIIGVLIGLLLPAVQSSREAARRRACSNHLLQLGIAARSYHLSFNQFPMQMSGTDGSVTVGRDNDRRLSIFVGLLPFMEQQALTDLIGRAQAPVTVSSPYGYSMGGIDEMEMILDIDGEDEDAESDGDAKTASNNWLPGGPEPFQANYQPWQIEVPSLRCNSDPGIGQPSMGRTNYAAVMGDGVVAIDTGPFKSVKGVFVIDPVRKAETEASMRGIFVPRSHVRLKDITDGASHTLLIAEIATDLGDRDARTDAVIGPGENVLRANPSWVYKNDLLDPDRPMFWRTGTVTTTTNANGTGRGFRWADGAPLFTGVNTILPPNRPIVLSKTAPSSSGYFSASSRHLGGINACFADGAVRYISDSIDSGDQHAPTPYRGSLSEGKRSPYGVWGAMGTRSSGELVLVSESFQ